MIATKAQELEALKKIQKIVEELGTDSYLSITFEGCFEQAKENIENDWGNSYKAMYDLSNKDLCEERHERENTLHELEAAKKKIKELETENKHWREEYKQMDDIASRWGEEANEAEETVKKQAQEIIELKAKLYDLMTK